MSERQHHGGLVWPVILIGAGVIFLLNNMGVLGWGVWETLLRLWPVLLIAVGLEILIGRRSLLGSALVALALVVVLGLAVALGLPQGTAGVNNVARTEIISEDLKGAGSANVTIEFGAGNLNLAALPAGSPQLLKGTVDLSQGEALALDHSGAGRLVLSSRGSWSTSTNFTPSESKKWDLELNRDVPITLEVSTGVGRSTLDLSQLNLARLDINGGVGQATVKLPERGQFDVTLDGGVGEITLIVPQGLAANIQTNGGLGGIQVDGDFNRNGDNYISPDYGAAANRAKITLNGGIGRIVIREVAE